MKQYLPCLIVLIATLAVSGCGNRRAPSTTGDKPLPLPTNSFGRQWINDIKVGNDPAAEIHLSEDTVFLYTRNHLVYAIGRSGGDLKYVAEPHISGGVLRSPLVLGERVIYASGSTMDVFSNRGKSLRTLELDKPIRSGAVGSGNTVYIGLDHTGGTGVVASIDITRPYRVINWELMAFGAVTPTPALYERVVYAGSEDGRIYAVTEERGAIWTLQDGTNTFNTQGRFVSDLKVDEYGVFASNTDSKLYCLDRTTGRIRWQYFAGVPLKTAPVVTATMVYQYVPGTGMVGIDKVNGQINRVAKWAVKNGVQVLSEGPQHVYLRARDNRVLAVDKASGEVLFTSKGSPMEFFATNTKDAIIYGGSRNGTIQAIRPILREGEVGDIVMDLVPQPLALAQ